MNTQRADYLTYSAGPYATPQSRDETPQSTHLERSAFSNAILEDLLSVVAVEEYSNLHLDFDRPLTQDELIQIKNGLSVDIGYMVFID